MAATEEEVSNATTDPKTEETPDSTVEDAPTSLETIPEGNAARNEIAPKDKSKSNFTVYIQFYKCFVTRYM